LLACGKHCRAIDLGCGDGTLTAAWAGTEWDVIGVDFSESGVGTAQIDYPTLHFYREDITGNLAAVVGAEFDVVVSAEVTTHQGPWFKTHSIY
jgi:2-polyprenyl-3-methyl-5-hydroxy-6-metoxy-1,4-benzoquinol methylase